MSLIFAGSLLSACANLQLGEPDLTGAFAVPPEYILLPNPPRAAKSTQDQAIILKLSELLDTKAHTAKERSELFYELGVVYDRLGLEATARSMFSNAISQKPDYAAPYNFAGIYFLSDGRYQDACEAFNASLELNSQDHYVNFNRGIAQYYAGRYKQAISDMLVFYGKQPEDPYILLWLYLSEAKLAGQDYAANNLKIRYQGVGKTALTEQWGFNLVKLYLGTLSEDRFFTGTKSYVDKPDLFCEHLCEGYFYLAKLKELAGAEKLAYDYFKLALATQRYGFLEYRYASAEAHKLERKYAKGLKLQTENFEQD
ncbi:MAG: lipoprotein NlpI [Succinivibrio sp.]|nr:lipoprotein NlpI [Succinivibrio sp.]